MKYDGFRIFTPPYSGPKMSCVLCGEVQSLPGDLEAALELARKHVQECSVVNQFFPVDQLEGILESFREGLTPEEQWGVPEFPERWLEVLSEYGIEQRENGYQLVWNPWESLVQDIGPPLASPNWRSTIETISRHRRGLVGIKGHQK